MIDDPQGSILVAFAAFCRIGGCMMVLPGFSSFRLPMQVRLFMAVALSLALMPMLWDTIYPRIQGGRTEYLFLVGSELLIGIVLGMIARFIVLGLQFAGTTVSMAIGFNTSPINAIFESEPEGQVTAVITTTGLLLLFMTDFHHMIISALVRSYDFMPMGAGFEARMALVTLSDTLSATFYVMLRLASPFLMFGFIFNLAIGMVNKLAPQIPVYFISTPFLLAGGLILFFLAVNDFFQQFVAAFEPLFLGAR
ncbi:flagellar biosynthetic protein FliR [Hoeflea marina]|uniref:Flagellar biosynthetic protein FliR n=1 Tax=Hoeflea marina TaxID=274592 RepID=A0A317PEE3_9HYPH|nr:flagellar biosynthetic protein FliR [Hoeflea marina]PWV95259.1 flagellar biosynthetic protein FliR [Hoeflea marina]